MRVQHTQMTCACLMCVPSNRRFWKCLVLQCVCSYRLAVRSECKLKILTLRFFSSRFLLLSISVHFLNFRKKNRKSKYFLKCARKMKGRTPVNPLPEVFNLKWNPKLVRKNPIRGCLTINFYDSIILGRIYRLVRNLC